MEAEVPTVRVGATTTGLTAPPPPQLPQGFLQAGCPSCRPTNSVKALKAQFSETIYNINKHVNNAKKLLQLRARLKKRLAVVIGQNTVCVCVCLSVLCSLCIAAFFSASQTNLACGILTPQGWSWAVRGRGTAGVEE